jgi:hypothetical protein
MKKNEANFYWAILAALIFCFAGFTACTQGNKEGQNNQAGQEFDKGGTGEVSDPCEGTQINNVLCHWVAASVEFRIKSPPPRVEDIFLRENEFNESGQIAKYYFFQMVGGVKSNPITVTQTYKDGKLDTKVAVPDDPALSSNTSHTYNANGDVVTQTLVQNNPGDPSYPQTTISTYDYQPVPPHDLIITKTTTDVNGATLELHTEKIIHTPDGKVLSWEYTYSDFTGTVRVWHFIENTYRDGKKHNSLTKIDGCNPVPCTPALLAQGPQFMTPAQIQRRHYEYDERNRVKSELHESFYNTGTGFSAIADISDSCEFKYDFETQAPMTHELPIDDFLQFWVFSFERDFFSKNDLVSQAICEITATPPAAPPSKTQYGFTITWKRLYEYLGVAKPN